MPVHNQLSTVRRCLVEVKKAGGPYSGILPSKNPLPKNPLLPFMPPNHPHISPFFASRLLLQLTLTAVARELYPYGMKLNSIDGMRIGGKFMTEDGSIPEGQGTVHALLAECYELLHELRSEIEEDD